MQSDSLLGNDFKPQQGARFDEMKVAIDKFKREMADIQAEIDSLQEQLQVKAHIYLFVFISLFWYFCFVLVHYSLLL